MSLIMTTTNTDGKCKPEVNVKELTLRLKSLVDGCNIEIIQLAISSMLEEIEEATR